MSIRGHIPNFVYAKIEQTEDGAKEIIAATSGKSILVVGYAMAITAEGTIVLKDSVATRASFNLAKQGGVAYAGGPDAPAFECAAGKALELENPAGVDTRGHITYLLL